MKSPHTSLSRQLAAYAALLLLFVISTASHAGVFDYDHDFVRPSAKATMGYGVDARTGTFSYSHTDISIGSDDAVLSLQRGYSSEHLSNPAASYGLGTNHSLDIYLVVHGRSYCQGGFCGTETMVAVVEGGQQGLFVENETASIPNGTFRTESYTGGTLEKTIVTHQSQTHTVYIYTDYERGYRIHFDQTDWSWGCNADYSTPIDSCIRASHIEYANGDFVALSNERTGNNIVRLKEAVNTRGYGLRFSYPSNSHLISQVSGFRIGCQSGSHVQCGSGTLPSVSYQYSGSRLSSSTDSEGHSLYYDYNGTGRLSAVRSSDAPSVKLFENTYSPGIDVQISSPDPLWRPVLFQDDDRGNPWAFTYEYPVDNLDNGGTWSQYTGSTQTDPQGGITRFVFGQEMDGAGNPLYDGSNNRPVHAKLPTLVTDPSGSKMRYIPANYGHLPPRETLYPSGRKTTYDRDIDTATVQLKEEITQIAVSGSGLADQQITLYRCLNGDWHNCQRKPQKLIDAKGGTIDFAYSATHGGLTAMLLPPDANGQRSLINYSYQAFYPALGVNPGLPWLTTTPVYRVTQTARCLAAASSLSASCSSAQKLTTTKVYQTSSSGSRSPHELQQVILDQGGLAITTGFVYDNVGNTLSVDGPLAIDDISSYSYDSNRRVLTQVAPRPDSQSPYPATYFYYNARGQTERSVQGSQTSRVSAFTPLRASCSSYDAAGRVTAAIGFGTVSSSSACPNSSAVNVSYTTMTYDSMGRRDQTTQHLASGDRTTKVTYFANGLTDKIIRAYGTTLQQNYQSYTYNAGNQVASVADANGNITNYQYDGHDRLQRTTFSDNSYETYGYDLNNNKISQNTRSEETLSYSFDPRNQPTGKTVPGALSSDPTAYTSSYDLAGRLTSDNHWSMTQSYLYDKVGRLIQKDHHNGSMPVSYQYDKASNLTQLTYPDGWQASFSVDALGRVTSINEGSSGQNEQPGRQLASLSYDSLSRRTAISYGNGVTTTAAYTAGNSVTDLDIAFPSSAQQDTVRYDYGYNKVGQTLATMLSDTTLLWTPGSTASTTYSSNALNQYTNINGQVISYDDNGNLTDRGNGWSYAYDAANGLSRAYLNGVQQAHYVHYADGNRRYKSANGQVSRFFYSGNQEILETGSSLSDKQRRYIRLPGSTDQVLLMLDYRQSQSNPTEVWAHQDRQGSTAITTDSSGAIVDKITYSSYGESDDASSAALPFLYTGQKYDEQTGLYYYKARIYHPKLGRFLQTDPVGYEDQMNLYAYVGNDPVNMVDPTGKVKKVVSDALKKVADAIKNGKNRGKADALRQERSDLIESGQSKSNLSPERKAELIETGKLKDMHGHHDPSVNNGNTLDDKIKIAQDGDNVFFKEKGVHAKIHQDAGGTRVKIDTRGKLKTSIISFATIVTTILDPTRGVPAPFSDKCADCI